MKPWKLLVLAGVVGLGALALTRHQSPEAVPPSSVAPTRSTPAQPRSVREIGQELDQLVSAAPTYEDLTPEARTQYEQLQAERLERLGTSADLGVRLSPPTEVATLDGKAYAEVSP